jgi:chaperonin GroEL
MPKPKVIGQPISSQHFTLGINTIADLLAPTLGPIGGIVCNQRDFKRQPELLDDSATTVRRILNLGDTRADVGAMLMRSMIWRVVQRAGDGGATAAVLARDLYADALRVIAGGANAMQVAKGVNLGVDAAVKAIRSQARPVNYENELAAVALTVVQEPGLAAVLGEMSYLLGPDAHVTIEKYVAAYLQQSYHPGATYKSQFASMYFYTDAVQHTAILPGGYLVLVDGRLDTTEQIVAILKAAKAAGAKALTIVAGNFTDEIIGILVANSRNQDLAARNDAQLNGAQQNGNAEASQSSGPHATANMTEANKDKKKASDAKQEKMLIVGVKLKDVGDDRRAAYDDLGMVTGATVFGRDWSKPLEDITADDLGKVLRTEVTKDLLHVVPERFHTPEVQEKTAELRHRLGQMTLDDEQRPLLVKRLSALSGGMGVLKIGAESKLARDVQAASAERALKVLSAAQHGGVVPGGGAAFFHAISALDAVKEEADIRGGPLGADVRFGVEMVQRALQAPLRQILENAHVSAPSWQMELIREAGPTATYDVMTGSVGDAFELGVLDVTNVLETVLRTAASSALMALTTDTIVYHKNPKEELNLG